MHVLSELQNPGPPKYTIAFSSLTDVHPELQTWPSPTVGSLQLHEHEDQMGQGCLKTELQTDKQTGMYSSLKDSICVKGLLWPP